MLTVLTVVAVTVLTRFLSFVLFPLPERTLAFVRYLGRVLPAAVFCFLVVYCLRGGDFTTGSYGIPEAVAVTAGIQAYSHQMMLAIAGGTALYMLLLQFVFSG